MAEEPQFGPQRKESFYQQRTGKWMVLFSQSRAEAGRLERVEDGHVILNPYHGTEPREGRIVDALVYKEAGMKLSDIVDYREISEKLISAICQESNEEREKIRRRNSKSFLARFLHL